MIKCISISIWITFIFIDSFPTNIWQAIGSMQVTIHFAMLCFCIYVTDFVVIPEIFEVNSPKKFLIVFTCITHQICMLRNFYKSVFTSSRVFPSFKEGGTKDKDKCTTCKKCERLRPRRSHHCSVCELCIDKMDHHCYVLNNCIGRHNYRYFFSYLCLTLANAIIIFTLCLMSMQNLKKDILEMKRKREKVYLFDILPKFPVRAGIVLLISGTTAIMLVYLVGYHLFLLYRDETTIERRYPVLKVNTSNKPKMGLRTKIHKMLHGNTLLDIYLPD